MRQGRGPGEFLTADIASGLLVSRGVGADVTMTTADASLFATAFTFHRPQVQPGDLLEFSVAFSVTQTSGATRVYSPTVKLGAATIFNSGMSAGLSTSATARHGQVRSLIRVEGLASQSIFTQLAIGGAGPNTDPYVIGCSNLTTATVDLTQPSSLDFLLASAADTATQNAKVLQAWLRHVPLLA